MVRRGEQKRELKMDGNSKVRVQRWRREKKKTESKHRKTERKVQR